MAESIPIYYEQLPRLKQDLIDQGNLALVLIDVSPFGTIEEEYGITTYSLVRQRLFDLLTEQAGREYRKEDILALEEPEGLRILLFLGPKRQSVPRSYKDLEVFRTRIKRYLVPNLVRAAFPYLKKPPQVNIGYGIGIYNPLLDTHHIVLRAIREAFERARLQYYTDNMEALHSLREIILSERVMTLFQPIVGIHDSETFGYEALSRASGESFFPSANELFDAAIQHRLIVELDRMCRKRALAAAQCLPDKAKIFVNTLPATMRDPEFQGQYLIDSLGHAGITPDRIVIEINEKLVIENLSLFQDSISYFTSLGMALAVDDVGAGYSGLETISKLRPSYLKIDASLTHDVHTSVVNREMLKAILLLGHGIEAKVIAEGVETSEELDALRGIGVDYGQGYFLGRPKTTT
jgi:EAL domain-containing protein (putative c-di-GMP-specific phosphodiesterase class I)